MKSIILFLLIAFTSVAISCEKKDLEAISESSGNDVPEVTISHGGGPYAVGDNFTIYIDVKTTDNLQKIEVTKKLDSNAEVVYQEVTSGFDGVNAHYFSLNSYTVENYSQITFSITATDVEGRLTTVTYTIVPSNVT